MRPSTPRAFEVTDVAGARYHRHRRVPGGVGVFLLPSSVEEVPLPVEDERGTGICGERCPEVPSGDFVPRLPELSGEESCVQNLPLGPLLQIQGFHEAGVESGHRSPPETGGGDLVGDPGDAPGDFLHDAVEIDAAPGDDERLDLLG